jgi:hypothetical protein
VPWMVSGTQLYQDDPGIRPDDADSDPSRGDTPLCSLAFRSDVGDMGHSKAPGFYTGILSIGCSQAEQPANVVQREAKLSHATNKA